MRLTLFAAVVLLVSVLGCREAVHSPSSRPAERAIPATAPATPADRYPSHPDTALESVLTKIARHAPGLFAIAAKDLRTGAVARVNADSAIALMSVVKLPVAVVVLDSVDHGTWTLSTPVTLEGRDMHPRGELGDRYPRGGGPVRLERLLTVMIRRSDNSAADALMRRVGGPAAVTAWLERHDVHGLRVDRTERGMGNDWYGLAPGADTMGSAEEIRVLRAQVSGAVHDSAAAAMLHDPRDTGTPDACVRLLELLWRGDLLSATATDTLKSMLARCATAPGRLPGMLPRGTPVARKTGTGGMTAGVTVAINDVGVMRLPNGDDVAIAVLVGGARGPVARTERSIARAAREVYDAWGGAGPPALQRTTSTRLVNSRPSTATRAR